MTTVEESVSSFDAEDQYRCRKKAYKWYMHYAKPTKESMCHIVDYANDGITREHIDLLPWNLEETEVINKAMKSLQKKKKEEKEKKYKKDKKKDWKEKERDEGEEDIVFPESLSYYPFKCPTLLNGEMSDSYTSLDLDFSQNSSSGSFDASSSNWDQDHTQEHCVSAEQVRTIAVEEEHTRKREERRLRREAVKKRVPELEVQEKSGSSGSLDASSSSWDQDQTQEHRVRVEQLRTIEVRTEHTRKRVEKEHTRKREERRRRREAAKKSVPEVDVQDKCSVLDAEDQYRCRKKAYKWYKHYAKPTKESMCHIADYANDGITREHIDLLPWNLEETEVINKAMKSLQKKKKEEKEKKYKKDKKKDQKENERC